MARRAGGDVEAGTSRGVHVAIITTVEEDDTRTRTYSHSGRTVLKKKDSSAPSELEYMEERRGEERREEEKASGPL